MAEAPAYLWYPKDVMSSGRVAALSALEELWYRRALDQSWLHTGMPKGAVEFAGWVGRGCTPESARKIIRKFFTIRIKGSDKVFNDKQEILRKEFKKKSRERSKAGIESGRKRRERSRLSAEQMFNKPEAKPNIPYPYPYPSSFSKSDFKRLIETCARENVDTDIRLVEIGVLYTMLQRNGATEPIKSTKYFKPEIAKVRQDAKAMGSKAIDALLKRRREQFWGTAT